MSAHVLTMSAEQTLAEAVRRLAASGDCDVYVVDSAHGLLGIVPDYELLKAHLLNEQLSCPLGSVMSSAVCTVDAFTPLCEVAIQMRSSFQRQMPVIDNGRLIGRITRTDLLVFLARQSSTTNESVSGDPVPQQPPAPNFLRALRKAQARNVASRHSRR